MQACVSLYELEKLPLGCVRKSPIGGLSMKTGCLLPGGLLFTIRGPSKYAATAPPSRPPMWAL